MCDCKERAAKIELLEARIAKLEVALRGGDVTSEEERTKADLLSLWDAIGSHPGAIGSGLIFGKGEL